MTRALVASVMLVLFPARVLADGLLHVPPWTMVNGKACYEFQDAKKLLVLDADMEALIQRDATTYKILQATEDGAVQLGFALSSEKDVTKALQKNIESLTRQLLAETTRANKAEAKPGMWPAWGVAGAICLGIGLLAGILLGVYVAK